MERYRYNQINYSLFTEKEIVRGPGEWDGGGVAYGGVGCVLDGAIGLYVANYSV